jgi:hypothetical protein
MVIAALALLAGTLVFTSIGSTQSALPTLSPTPPVKLASPSTAPVSRTSTSARPQLPKTGLDAGLLALVGLAFMATGKVVRPPPPRRAASRRRR